MSRWFVALLVSGSMLGGCAFSLSGPAPGRPRNEAPECDTSKGLVVLDGLMATTMGVTALSLVSGSEPSIALLPLAVGALYLGGAVKGNSEVNSCRAATAEYENAESARATLARTRADEDDEEEPTNRYPTRAVQPPPQPTPTAYPAPVAPITPPVQASSVAQPPVAQPPVAQPPVAQPATPLPASKRPPPKPQPADDDDWSDFWREVP